VGKEEVEKVRVYSSAVAMLHETAREVFSRGVWVYDKTRQAKEVKERSKEIIGYSYMLTSFHDLPEMFDLARTMFKKDFLRIDIAEHWFQEMFEDKNPQTFWLKHPELAEYYMKYCSMSGGAEAYTYGERVSKSYDKVINLLAQNLERRAAVIPVFWEIDVDRVGKMRVPCSMFYQFLVRRTIDGYELNLIYVQRSCDLAWFFTFDAYRAIRLIQKATKDLREKYGIDVREGSLIHFISSLHAFESDVDPNFRW